MTRAAGRTSGSRPVDGSLDGVPPTPAAPALAPAEPAPLSRRASLSARFSRVASARAVAGGPPAPHAGAAPKPRAGAARPAPGTPRARAGTLAALDEPMWGRLGLLVLLALVVVAQMVIGLVSHFTVSAHRPLLVDVFYFNTLLVLPGCIVFQPLARRLTHQARPLRFMESLSFGAVYAIFALLLTSAFLPVGGAGQTNANALIDQLKTGNVPGLALGDLLAVLAAVQIYPGLSRVLGAPGRRARRRLLERQQPGSGGAAARAKPGPRRRG